MDSLLVPTRPALLFLVVLTRVGGLVTFAPFWSHKAANAKTRIVLACALAFVITPVVMNRLTTPPSDGVGLTLVLTGELLIGFVLGFVGRLIFSALEIAAQVIGFQMGFSLAGTIDPSTQAQTAAFGTLAQMLGLMVLLASDGHHWLLAATVRSFTTTAPGNFHVSASLAQLIIRLSADALAVGVALAAPAVVVLLAVELVVAVAGRAAPQLQVMILSFPLKIAAGLWLIGASLYMMPGALRATIGAIRVGLARALIAISL